MPVRGGGFLQGYNPQNVTSQDGLVIATRLTSTPGDVQWYEPMIAEAMEAAAMMAAAGGPGTGEIGLALADAGYLSEANLTCPGPDRLIATGKRRDLEKAATRRSDAGKTPRKAADQPPAAAMAARLATEDGIAAYRRRGHIGETFHGDLKHNHALPPPVRPRPPPGIRRVDLRRPPSATSARPSPAATSPPPPSPPSPPRTPREKGPNSAGSQSPKTDQTAPAGTGSAATTPSTQTSPRRSPSRPTNSATAPGVPPPAHANARGRKTRSPTAHNHGSGPGGLAGDRSAVARERARGAVGAWRRVRSVRRC